MIEIIISQFYIFIFYQFRDTYLRYGIIPIPQIDYLSGSFLRFALL